MTACVVCERPDAPYRIRGTEIMLCGECAMTPSLWWAYAEGITRLAAPGEAHRALNPRAYGDAPGEG